MSGRPSAAPAARAIRGRLTAATASSTACGWRAPPTPDCSASSACPARCSACVRRAPSPSPPLRATRSPAWVRAASPDTVWALSFSASPRCTSPTTAPVTARWPGASWARRRRRPWWTAAAATAPWAAAGTSTTSAVSRAWPRREPSSATAPTTAPSPAAAAWAASWAC